LPVVGGVRTFSGSNQIDGDLRRLKLSLQAEQFVVRHFVGAQLLMTSSYHAGFTRCIPSDDLANKAVCTEKTQEENNKNHSSLGQVQARHTFIILLEVRLVLIEEAV
jgi:hypothetical protein